MMYRRISRIVTLSVTIAAVAAPTAMAGGSQHRVVRDLRYAMQTSSLAGTPGIDHRTPDAVDAATGRGIRAAPKVTVVKVPQPTSSSTGLDWGDAGIGAGAVLGLMLLALGSGLAIAHRRQGARGSRTVA
jgi:hypothetical protein